jgi:autotransporter-associated beta strand protein
MAQGYVVGGPGGISGSTTLTVNGVGSVTLTSANTYTGATTLNAGTLNLATGSAVGSTSSIIMHGGVLAFSADTTLTRPITFTTAGQIDTAGYNVTYTGTIAGSSKLIKIGGGSLTMTPPPGRSAAAPAQADPA